MAEQTSTSRTLDYGIDKHILDRIQKAGEVPEGQVGMIGDVFTGIQTDALKLAKDRQALEDARLQAELDWDASFDELGNRGSWTTPGVYDQVFSLNAEMKERYLVAVNDGDKALQAEILREQQNLSNYTQNWKLEIEDNLDNFKKGYYSKSLQGVHATEDKHIMESLNKMNNVDFILNDNNEMEFRILNSKAQSQIAALDLDLELDTIDEATYQKELNEILTNPDYQQSVTLRDVQRIKEKYISSDVVSNAYLQNANAARTLGRNGGGWENSYDQMYSRNSGTISKDNIQNMFYDNFTESATTFVEDMLNPTNSSVYDWDQIPQSLIDKKMKLTIPEGYYISTDVEDEYGDYTEDGDGFLTGDEFLDLDDEDRETIIEILLLPENYEVARAYLSQWMTLKQESLFDEGSAVYEIHGPEKKKNKKKLS